MVPKTETNSTPGKRGHKWMRGAKVRQRISKWMEGLVGRKNEPMQMQKGKGQTKWKPAGRTLREVSKERGTQGKEH